ncbi:hypothetical protein F5Y01DRAFT_317215 [Xylaria sp. FL0043]|nr:hypothetical protein F5Y01DRAFT_317215 [Xylaria sp. FL0043]
MAAASPSDCVLIAQGAAGLSLVFAIPNLLHQPSPHSRRHHHHHLHHHPAPLDVVDSPRQPHSQSQRESSLTGSFTGSFSLDVACLQFSPL